MSKKLIFILILLICFICSKAQININLESVSRPIVKVKINDKTEYLLIDTGSTINILTPDAVNLYKFRIRTRYAGTLYSITDKINAFHVDNVLVKLENIIIYQFVMIDISTIVLNIWYETGIKISGILGTPAIKDLGMIINLSKNNIIINNSKNYNTK